MCDEPQRQWSCMTAPLAKHSLQSLADVAQHLARLPVALLAALALQRLHLLRPLAVALQLLLQLRYRVRALLVLLLEHRLDARQLLPVGLRRQLQILVHVVVARLLLLAYRLLGAGHLRV